MPFEITAGALKAIEILNVRRLPGKLTVDQTAALLGFASHDIPILVSAGLLRPLGKPKANSSKWFPGVVVDELRGNVKWMDSAIKIIADHWRASNARRLRGSEPPLQDTPT